ncbi:hypothetical protein ACOMHN_028048 [Nucella lapillus]
MAGYRHRDSHSTARLDSWCEALQKDNDQLKHEVDLLTNKCYILEEQCKNLFEWKDLFIDVSQKMDTQVDRLESFSRRNNLRFFNVFEGPKENNFQCTRKVIQLLNRFFPIKQWSIDDVERAHRIGPRNEKYEQPRPIIARLFHWQDKLSILMARDNRKEMADTLNICVASDLTNRQNQIIREEKDAGRQAYVWKGHMFHKNRKNQQDDHQNGWRKYSIKTFNFKNDQNYYKKQGSANQENQNAKRTSPYRSANRHQRHGMPLPQQDPTHCESDDLPWTADMASFPSLSRQKMQKSASIHQAHEGRTSQHHSLELHNKPITGRGCDTTTLQEGASTNEDDEISPMLQLSNPPKPQRPAETKGRTSVNQWGIILLSSPDSDDGNHAVHPKDRNDDGCLPFDSLYLLPQLSSSSSHPHPTPQLSSTPSHPHPTSQLSYPPSHPHPTSQLSSTPSHLHLTPPPPTPTSHLQPTPQLPPSPSHPHLPPKPPSSPAPLPHADANADSSETFVKQLADPWISADEVERQSPVYPTPKAERNIPPRTKKNVVKPDQQNFSLESETPRPQTRLARRRAMSRQQHVTECFPCVGVSSSRPKTKKQPPTT